MKSETLFHSRFLNTFVLGLALATAGSPDAWSQRNLRIRSSGTDGRDASDGSPGRDGSSGWGGSWGGRGSDGGNGSSAGNSTPGTHAGHISIRLTRAGGKQVRLAGQILGNNPATLDQLFSTDTVGSIDLEAAGGRGGDGGRGGNGGDGGDGGRGSDATRYSSGSNGGNGGDGGHGGNGSPGSDGGNGGDIQIEADERETELLMLIGNVVNPAGAGGSAGANGQGGRAGSGGWGGSSYSWSESVYDGTDQNGNTKYRTEYHSNPGGSSGWSGSRGNDGNGDVSAGARGRDGGFRYLVNGRTFVSRYDVQVVGFDIESENHDGIIEPGEIVTISRILIRNRGGMPTPKLAPLKLFLRNQGWVVGLAQTLRFSSVIEPGQTAEVEGTIQFRIANQGIATTGKPLASGQSVSPRVNQTGVDRDYAGSESPTDFTVQYPLKLDPIQVPRNLGPGQSAQVSLVIRNVSTREYGKLSDLKRVIQSLLVVNGSRTTTMGFELRDSKGRLIDLSTGNLSRIDRLAPGASITLAARISIPAQAEVYEKIGLDAQLKLGSREKGKGAEANLIQTREAQINISYVYHRTPESRLVLVTNHGTTQDELKAWTRMLRSYGIAFDVWDLSYEGGLDFERVTSSGARLSEDLRGKSLVVLNNLAEDARAFQLVSREQILKYAVKNQVRVHFVGGDSRELLTGMNDLLVPAASASGHYAAGTEELQKEIGKALQPSAKSASPKSVRFLGQMRVRESDWFRIDTFEENRMGAFAGRFEKTLRLVFPERRFILMYDYAPKVLEDGYVVNKVELGVLRVYETIPDADSHVSALQVADSDLHLPSFVGGGRNQLALLSTLSLLEKLALLERALSRRLSFDERNLGIALEQVRVALLSDIAMEQKSLRKRPDSPISDTLSRQSRYETLEAIALSLGQAARGPHYSRFVERLAHDVYRMARSVYHDDYWFNNSFWDPNDTNRAVSDVTKGWVKKLLKVSFGKDEAAKVLDRIQDGVEKASAKLTKEQRRAYLDHWTAPVAGLVRDGTLLSLPEDRIVSGDELREIQSRAADAAATRKAFLDQLREEKNNRE